MDGWTQRNAVGRREQTVITQSFCCHPPSFFPLPPEVLSAVPVSSTPRAVDGVAGTLGTGEAPSRSFSLPLTTLLQPPAPLQVHSGPPPLLSSLSGKFPPQISSLAPPLPWISVQMSPYQMPPSREKGRPSFPTSCTSHPWPCCFSSSYSSPPDSLHVYFSTSCVFNIENSKNTFTSDFPAF